MKDVYFENRIDAGEQLYEKLIKYKNKNPVILALPRGGVVLGDIIAKKLHCPLDLLITRKIGHPYSPEYAIGAITMSGEGIFNETELKTVSKKWLEKEKKTQQEEAKRRQEVYLGGRKPIGLKNKTVIIVDDGIATGLTMEAGIKEVRDQKPKRIVIAVPVSPPDTYDRLSGKVDDFVAVSIPDYFLGSIGAYYSEFLQVSDDEVIEIMKKS